MTVFPIKVWIWRFGYFPQKDKNHLSRYQASPSCVTYMISPILSQLARKFSFHIKPFHIYFCFCWDKINLRFWAGGNLFWIKSFFLIFLIEPNFFKDSERHNVSLKFSCTKQKFIKVLLLAFLCSETLILCNFVCGSLKRDYSFSVKKKIA